VEDKGRCHNGVKIVGSQLCCWDWRFELPRPTISLMEISLAPELEQRLARIASEAGKAANQVVQELVADYLDHDEWFKQEVQKGLASLDSGKFVPHEEVGRQIERILRP